MKIAIIGGTGYLGKGFIAYLNHNNIYDYKILSRGYNKIIDKSKYIKCDIEDISSLNRALKNIDVVIDFVGILKEKGQVTYESVHVRGMRNIVKASKENKVKQIIYISALGTRKNAVSMYHKTKYQAEEILKSSGINYTIIRPGFIFSEDDISINIIAKTIKNLHIFPLFNYGKYKLRLIYKEDLYYIILNCIGKINHYNKLYSVGENKEYTYRELFKKISEIENTFLITIPIPKFIVLIGSKIIGIINSVPISYQTALMLFEDNTCSLKFKDDFKEIELHSFEEEFRKYVNKI